MGFNLVGDTYVLLYIDTVYMYEYPDLWWLIMLHAYVCAPDPTSYNKPSHNRQTSTDAASGAGPG